MSIGSRIRSAREAKGLTQAQLADKVGNIKSSVVSMWENGNSRPDLDRFSRLCAALDITADELLGLKLDTNRPTLEEVERNRKIRVLDEHGLEMVDFVVDKEYARVTARAKKKARILKVDWYNIPASAGTGSFLDNETAEPILVYETSEAERADFALSVSGDSMEPEFHDGDKVFVQQQNTVEEGEIGIFVINGDAYIKQLGKKCLISLNPNYKPIPLHDDDAVYCCGKVLGIVEEYEG